MKYLNGYIVIRLTEKEFNQLSKLTPGEIFYHINLQHSGIPYRDFEYKNYYAAALKVKGIDNGIDKREPILNMDKVAFLELIEIEHSLPIRQINPTAKDKNITLLNQTESFILESNKGLYESVWIKYKKIRNLKKREFNKMMFFVRKFKLIEIQDNQTQ